MNGEGTATAVAYIYQVTFPLVVGNLDKESSQILSYCIFTAEGVRGVEWRRGQTGGKSLVNESWWGITNGGAVLENLTTRELYGLLLADLVYEIDNNCM